jgi:hypothetical protein
MKFLIMQFSPTSCHFIPLWSKYSPQHPIFKHPQSTLNMCMCPQGDYFYWSTCKVYNKQNLPGNGAKTIQNFN